MKKNIFEAKYIIQRNTEYWGGKKKALSLDPTFYDGKEHTYPSKRAPLLSS